MAVLVKLFSAVVAVIATILAEYLFIHILTMNFHVVTLTIAVLLIGMILLLTRVIKLTISEPHFRKTY